MPQLPNAKKALRTAARKRIFNDRWRRAFRRSVKEVRDAITAGDSKKAAELYPAAQKNLDRAARRNIIHPNAAARTKARLSRAIAKAK